MYLHRLEKRAQEDGNIALNNINTSINSKLNNLCNRSRFESNIISYWEKY